MNGFTSSNTSTTNAKHYSSAGRSAFRQKKTRVLSIDGGGIRGVLPATIICYLEEQLQIQTQNRYARISDFIDFMAGTSTGSILTCLYLTPDPREPQRARLSAEQVLHHYMQDSHAIFDRSLVQKNKEQGQFCQKYNSDILASRLRHTIGEQIKLSELIRPCIIPAYDLNQARPHIFHSRKSAEVQDYFAWQVAKASSSAPILFRPTPLTRANQELLLVDGGLFAKNPSLYAYLEAQCCSSASEQEVLMISIGTGTTPVQHPLEQMRRKGAIGWMKPLLDIVTSTGAGQVERQVQQMARLHRHAYFRLEPPLLLGMDSLDDASEENLQALLLDGLNYIEQNKALLDQIVAQLLED